MNAFVYFEIMYVLGFLLEFASWTQNDWKVEEMAVLLMIPM